MPVVRLGPVRKLMELNFDVTSAIAIPVDGQNSGLVDLGNEGEVLLVLALAVNPILEDLLVGNTPVDKPLGQFLVGLQFEGNLREVNIVVYLI